VALVHRERHVIDWPSFGFPERWRRLLDFEGDEAWIKTEEYHEGDTLIVRAELPGIDPDKDIEITVSGGVVHLRARREQKAERTDKRGYRSEFRYGQFRREIALPEGTASEDVKASYANGILEVRVPCPEKAEPAAVKVAVEKG
jgi:HSP20 family protein